MSQAQTATSQAIEYSVYVYHDTKKKGQAPWEMKGVTGDMDKALKSAEQLIETDEYQKVEVKKKFFDEKNNRTVDITLKVLEAEEKLSLGAFAILVFAVFCGMAAFGLSFFLSGGA